VFLDEVGELSPAIQAKLLRVVEQREVLRLGATRPTALDVRFVAATNRDLLAEVEAGRFREDLYYRLNVFPIETPPLRAHPEDLAILAVRVVHDLCRRMHRALLAIAPADLAILEAYDWPGNVRELQNILERAMVSTPHTASHLVLPRLSRRTAPLRAMRAPSEPPSPAPALPLPVLTDSELRNLTRDNLLAALRATSGRIAGPGGAAELLGLKPSTLASRLRKLGIEPAVTRRP
jgi:transcriptional regulator with GAF, ATPase, and Fis domain